MWDALKIPLSRIPDEGLELDSRLGTNETVFEEEDWPPLSDVGIIGRLDRTGPQEFVFRGRARGSLLLQCNLGLAEFQFNLDEPFIVYFRPRSEENSETEIELGEEDIEVSYIDDEYINLLAPLRDQLGLAVPLQPRCPGKCLGENPENCRRLKAGEGVAYAGEFDSRWSGLREWKE
jgi:uncharacterized metal-binding protein YceD (DUF177 family)